MSALEDLRAKCQKHQPHKVRLMQGDEAARDIAVSTNRKRWDAVIDAAAKIAWSSAELLDKHGAVLCIVENLDVPTDLESLDGVNAVRDERLLSLLLRGQREVLTFRDKDNAAAMQACVQTMKEMAGAFTQLAALYREQVKVAAETATWKANRSDGDKDELISDQFMSALMPELVKRLMAGGLAAPAPGANGTNGAKTPPPSPK